MTCYCCYHIVRSVGWDTAVALWERHYTASCKVAVSRHDEVNECFPSSPLGPRVYSASNRN
jgi:hypothetical protein